MALHANDPIMSGTLIWSFRHLEYQNLSIISDSKGRARMVKQFWKGGGAGTEEEWNQRSTVVLEDTYTVE